MMRYSREIPKILIIRNKNKIQKLKPKKMKNYKIIILYIIFKKNKNARKRKIKF